MIPIRVPVSGVDRRFNRSKVDAQRSVAAFGARPRDEANPGRVERLLAAAAAASVQPAGAGACVRGGEAPR